MAAAASSNEIAANTNKLETTENAQGFEQSSLTSQVSNLLTSQAGNDSLLAAKATQPSTAALPGLEISGLDSAAAPKAAASDVAPASAASASAVTTAAVENSDPIVMKSGDSGSNVGAVQNKLASLAYDYADSADGKYGPMTQKAVTEFQTANGLSVTGQIDQKTLDQINSPNAVANSLDQYKVDAGAIWSQTGKLPWNINDPEWNPKKPAPAADSSSSNDGNSGGYSSDDSGAGSESRGFSSGQQVRIQQPDGSTDNGVVTFTNSDPTTSDYGSSEIYDPSSGQSYYSPAGN